VEWVGGGTRIVTVLPPPLPGVIRSGEKALALKLCLKICLATTDVVSPKGSFLTEVPTLLH
jgi:hypothetical protein